MFVWFFRSAALAGIGLHGDFPRLTVASEAEGFTLKRKEGELVLQDENVALTLFFRGDSSRVRIGDHVCSTLTDRISLLDSLHGRLKSFLEVDLIQHRNGAKMVGDVSEFSSNLRELLGP